MPIACITGATAGIGRATAEAFAGAGWSVIINGRRGEELAALANDLCREGVRCLPLPFDVSDAEAVTAAFATLPEEWSTIDVLVNNAGLGLGLGPIQEGIPEDWNTMIDVNIKGLLWVTHAILPGMIERKRGHIVNLGSIAGKEIYKNGNIYCMTKHAVDALSKAMRIDLLPHGIRVTAIHPGKVETEFSLTRFKGDAVRAKKEYEGYTPLAASDVADAILYCVTRPAHVCINDLVIMPTDQANTTHLLKE